MKKKRKIKIFLSDLKPLFKKCLIIIADYNNVIFCDKNNDEKGFIYPHNSFSGDDILATIVIYKNKINNIDDFCITLLHELIHLYLYTKNIHDHDESFIDHEAERIYNLEKNGVLKFIKKYYNINNAVS